VVHVEEGGVAEGWGLRVGMCLERCVGTKSSGVEAHCGGTFGGGDDEVEALATLADLAGAVAALREKGAGTCDLTFKVRPRARGQRV